jgi:hypothetical protein
MLRLIRRANHDLPDDFALPIHGAMLCEAVERVGAALAAVAPSGSSIEMRRSGATCGVIRLLPGPPSGSGAVSWVMIWVMVSMASLRGGSWIARV